VASQGYKKYMKKSSKKDYNLLKLFIVSFFGMLLVFTFIIKSFTPTVDVSIGDYKQEQSEESIKEVKNNVDSRLAMIQEEDQGRSFSEMMKNPEDVDNKTENNLKPLSSASIDNVSSEDNKNVTEDAIYKVFIGSYTTAEQAKVAKDIIIETGANLNPIVKCIGANNYTLQVGIFKNKNSAEALLYTLKQNNLPGRIVQES